MTMENIPPEALEEVADYFKVLSEPTRLQLLNILRQGEKSVGELAKECGFAIANISKHLSILTAHGLLPERAGERVLFIKLMTSRFMTCVIWSAATLQSGLRKLQRVNKCSCRIDVLHSRARSSKKPR